MKASSLPARSAPAALSRVMSCLIPSAVDSRELFESEVSGPLSVARFGQPRADEPCAALGEFDQRPLRRPGDRHART